MENKKAISQFEFAIMELADPERAKEYRPLTDDEVYQQRLNNLKEQAKDIKILTNN